MKPGSERSQCDCPSVVKAEELLIPPKAEPSPCALARLPFTLLFCSECSSLSWIFAINMRTCCLPYLKWSWISIPSSSTMPFLSYLQAKLPSTGLWTLSSLPYLPFSPQHTPNQAFFWLHTSLKTLPSRSALTSMMLNPVDICLFIWSNFSLEIHTANCSLFLETLSFGSSVTCLHICACWSLSCISAHSASLSFAGFFLPE